MKRLPFFALTIALLCSASHVQAVTVVYKQAGVAYTIPNAAAASNGGSGTLTYQWYKNGIAIASSNAATYTIPAGEASGTNVEFQRCVQNSNCVGEWACSNTIVITFCQYFFNGQCFASSAAACNAFGGTEVAGLCWANANVDSYQTFATKPDMYTKLYQWNRSTAWAAADGSVSGWTTTSISDVSWTVNPCPTGGRLPTQAEFQALHNAGTMWANANAKGNAIAGRFYGPSYGACTLPSNMSGCIFLPAAGGRDNNGSVISNPGTTYGLYWSSTQYSSANGYSLFLYGTSSTTGSDPAFNQTEKAFALSVRCVKQ